MNTNKFTTGIIVFLIGLITPIFCLVKSIQFNQNCSGYLKQAADASTVNLALDRINKAVDYIESNNLTEGYTSVLWKTEDENIGFWYQNIKACKFELENGLDGSQLEQTNLLMKIRETLIDNGENGTVLTIPDGISRYPYNGIIGILNWISAFLMTIGLALIFIYLNERDF